MMLGWIKLHRQITENIYWFSKRFTKAQSMGEPLGVRPAGLSLIYPTATFTSGKSETVRSICCTVVARNGGYASKALII